MVTGVTQGFEKRLEIVGVGFRADFQGKALKLSLGFSHPVLFPVPEGIKIEVEKQTQITVKGIDRQQVGTVAAKLRAIKPPDLIKGREYAISEKGFVRRSERPKLKEPALLGGTGTAE